MGISTHIYILRSWLWRRFKKLWIHGNERTNSKYSNSSKRLLFPQTQNTSCTLHVHAHTHSHINWVFAFPKRIVPWSFRRLLIFFQLLSQNTLFYFSLQLCGLFAAFFLFFYSVCMENYPVYHSKELTVAIERPTTTIEYSASDYIILMIQKQLWLQEFTTTMVFKNKKMCGYDVGEQNRSFRLDNVCSLSPYTRLTHYAFVVEM